MASPGVIYVGHLPRGLFEPQLKSYFSQFGSIRKLRLSRSKKTGNCKGYAFIEFEYDEVAKIAAETMNNYLMFERLIKCQYVPPDEVHPKVWDGAFKKFRKPKSRLLAIQRHNLGKDPATERAKLRHKMKARNKKLKSLGIDYSFQQPVADKPDVKVEDEFSAAVQSADAEAVLVEDSSEDEIAFKTPPRAVKSTRLASRRLNGGKTSGTRTFTPRSHGKERSSVIEKSKLAKKVPKSVNSNKTNRKKKQAKT